MFYGVLIAIVILLLQVYLSKGVTVGLIIPLGSIFGVILSGMMIFASDGGGWEEPNNRLLLLIFLFLTIVSFLLYFVRRKNEYRQGYFNNEKIEKKKNTGNSEW